jgi:hypothetical protein
MLKVMTVAIQQTLFVEEIRVLSDLRQGQSGGVANVQTIPDTSLPWSKEAGPDGYSAKMFLHQTIKTFAPRWSCSDTERLLSEQTPIRLQAKTEQETLLSDVIKEPCQKSLDFILSDKAARGLIKRNIKRRRDIRVLLRTHAGTMRVMVTFGTGQDGFAPQIKTKEQGLPVFLVDGLMDYLKQRLQELRETP